jgi:hypothetical protein
MPAAEPNRYLAKVKTSLVKRWSHTRMEELYEELDLATYLWALEREPEALDVLRSVSAAVPTPPQLRGGGIDYNVWSPVAAINAMQARLQRLAGNGSDAAVPIARLLADVCLAPNQQFIAGQVAEADDELARAHAKASTKWACLTLSRTIGSLVLLGELAAAGHPYAVWIDSARVEASIGAGRRMLRDRLASAN